MVNSPSAVKVSLYRPTNTAPSAIEHCSMGNISSSLLTPQTSGLAPHTSDLAPKASHLSPQTSHLRHHTSHLSKSRKYASFYLTSEKRWNFLTHH